MNYQLYKLMKQIEEINEINCENFTRVLQQYNCSEADYQEMKRIEINGEMPTDTLNYLNLRKEIFQKDNRNYFTICSKQSFNNLTSDTNTDEWVNTLVYCPLNDHSRQYLTKGDVLFCYRQGQFGSLTEALNTRGIYGIGVAVSDPLIIYPDKADHTQYGIIVAFPILLNNHLQLRNIQMHPKTIDLTPYNGNRNDALQYIPLENHYLTLLSLILQVNPNLKDDIQEILGIQIQEAVLPDIKWQDNIIVGEEDIIQHELFDKDAFIECLDEAGLYYNPKLVSRFIASLCTKPFVILTGLSGSGKTQLAINFVKWISGNRKSKYTILRKVLYESEIMANYEVVYLSERVVELINISGASKKIISLPTKVIYEWYDALVEGKIEEDDDPKEARHLIGEESIYQKYTQGFYSEFKKLALAMKEVANTTLDDLNLKQFEVVSVGADWTNREPLLGYSDALKKDQYVKPANGVLDLLKCAKENPGLPFFIILDEMNLSHVERYFADFLSAMESGEPIALYDKSEVRGDVEPRLVIPSNVFIIGTVNIDETTYMFSPKVLDRANTIEFRISEEEMSGFLNNFTNLDLEKIEGKGYQMSKSFLSIAEDTTVDKSICKKHVEILTGFFKELKVLGAEFGYRTANEIYKLLSVLTIIDSTLTDDEKIDIVIVQKFLPKLHGPRRKICPVLIALAKLCVIEDVMDVENTILRNDCVNYTSNPQIKYLLSLEKISRMYRNAIDNGYASYAEA